jgi:TPR repeat protein
MSLKLFAKVSLSVLAVFAAAFDLASQQHVTGAAYSVQVRPCGEFGKPPCGTVVNIPAGSTGESLYFAGAASQKAGRDWEAIIYIDQSAQLGYPRAEAALGEDFVDGLSVPKDLTKGRYWLQKAAEAGNAPSCAAIAEMLEKGQGGPPDQAQAIHYYELSAAAHIPRGEMDLAVDYEVGHGVAHNRAKAISLFRQAVADHGTHDPQRWVDALNRAGTRRFNSADDLWAYVYPAPRQSAPQQRANRAAAQCPGEPSFSAGAYMARSQFCGSHPGCPIRAMGIEQNCPR